MRYYKKYITLFSVLLLGIGEMWGFSSTYYSALKAQVSSTGGGKVYAGTSTTAGTYVDGSSTSESQSSDTENEEKTFYAFAKANEGYSFTGWSSTNGGSIVSINNPYQVTVKCSSDKSSSPTTTTVYANFAENQAITIRFISGTNGSYTVNGTKISTSQTLTCEGETALEATASSGYKFFGWYTSTDGGATRTYFSHTASTSYTFLAEATVYAEFIPSSVASFVIKGTSNYFYDLAQGLTAAASSTSKVLVVATDGSVAAGTYTIPKGVTLLIPFDGDYTCYTTTPGVTKAAPSGQSAYRTLTLAKNAKINVNGAISVSAHQNKGQPYGGAVTGKYGKIELQEGANITLSNGSALYCWGYITGDGTVEALNGATVYENFQITCWRGGSCASKMLNNDEKVFPLAQYAIQNVESEIIFHYGAEEYVHTGVTVNPFDPEMDAKIIGTSGCLFQLGSGATLSRKYNASSDRQVYQIDGNALIGYVSMDIYVEIDSRNYVLPLTNNMDVIVNTGTMSCNNDVALLPGASVTIKNGAKVSLGSSCNFYIYDKAEWPEKTTGFNYPGNVAFCKVAYTDTKIKTARTYANMTDAKLNINGTLELSKALYTTAGGADVCSTEGTGKILFKAAAGTETTTYQAVQESNYVKEYTAIPITSSQLHNADGSYLATAGTAANTTINYANGHWGWVERWKDGSTILKSNNTVSKVNNAEAQDALLPANTAEYIYSWETTVDETKQEVTHAVKATALAKYTILFKNEDGSILTNPAAADNKWAKDAVPSYTGAIPTKAPELRYTYVFDGWTLVPDGDKLAALPAATADATYYAHYNRQIRLYTITWLNMDGSEIDASIVEYGAQLTHSIPIYSDGSGKIYQFSGWKRNNTGVVYEPSESGAILELETYACANESYTAQYIVVADLVATEESPVVINTNSTVITTTVRVKGDLIVSEGSELTTEVLVVEGSTEQSGSVKGSVKANKAYFDLSNPDGFKARTWYSVAVPWQVSVPAYNLVNSGVSVSADGLSFTKLELGRTYDLLYYDGARRAKEGHSDDCWKYVEHDNSSEHILYPGRAYMIYFLEDVQTIRFERKSGASLYTSSINVTAAASHTGSNRDASWNGIANPSLYPAYLNAAANDANYGLNYGQVYNGISDTYSPFDMSANKLLVGQAIFVQSEKTEPIVANSDVYASVAPRRSMNKPQMSCFDIILAPIDGEETDRVIVRMSDVKSSNEYVVGQDMSKMGISKKVAQMWIDKYETNLLINTEIPVNNQADYPLSIRVPQDGEYLIYIEEQEQEETMLYLTYDNEPIWNLCYGGYVANLKKGTDKHYGLRMVRNNANVLSGIKEASVENSAQIRKVLIGDNVYIIRNGVVYTIDGQRIK